VSEHEACNDTDDEDGDGNEDEPLAGDRAHREVHGHRCTLAFEAGAAIFACDDEGDAPRRSAARSACARCSIARTSRGPRGGRRSSATRADPSIRATTVRAGAANLRIMARPFDALVALARRVPAIDSPYPLRVPTFHGPAAATAVETLEERWTDVAVRGIRIG
jgi:hypothetical protein